MNREIKFRTLYKGQWYNCTADEAFMINQESMTDSDYAIVTGENRTLSTGLFDKNRKEVFEGDILTHPEQESFFKWEVRFENGCFGVSNICDSPIKDFHPCKGQYYFDDRIIIGNIFENPELLNS